MKKRSEKDQRAEEMADAAFVMGDERGRRFVRWVLSLTGMWKSVFREQRSVRPEERLVFNGAWRDLGQIVNDQVMEAHPIGFQLMNNEAYTRKAMEDADEQKSEAEDE